VIIPNKLIERTPLNSAELLTGLKLHKKGKLRCEASLSKWGVSDNLSSQHRTRTCVRH
jgi:hypothetical protein